MCLYWTQTVLGPSMSDPFQGMNEHAIYLAVGKDRLRPSTSALKPRYGSIVINLVHAMLVEHFHPTRYFLLSLTQGNHEAGGRMIQRAGQVFTT